MDTSTHSNRLEKKICHGHMLARLAGWHAQCPAWQHHSITTFFFFVVVVGILRAIINPKIGNKSENIYISSYITFTSIRNKK